MTVLRLAPSTSSHGTVVASLESMTTPVQLIPYNTSASSASTGSAFIDSFWGGDGLGFKDILDVINPLQQIPIVSSLYRAVTGDTISTASRLAGGALLGGPLGLASAFANSVFESETGNDIGGTLLSLFSSGDSATQTASSGSYLIPFPVSAEQKLAYNAYVRAQSLTS